MKTRYIFLIIFGVTATLMTLSYVTYDGIYAPYAPKGQTTEQKIFTVLIMAIVIAVIPSGIFYAYKKGEGVPM